MHPIVKELQILWTGAMPQLSFRVLLVETFKFINVLNINCSPLDTCAHYFFSPIDKILLKEKLQQRTRVLYKSSEDSSSKTNKSPFALPLIHQGMQTTQKEAAVYFIYGHFTSHFVDSYGRMRTTICKIYETQLAFQMQNYHVVCHMLHEEQKMRLVSKFNV